MKDEHRISEESARVRDINSFFSRYIQGKQRNDVGWLLAQCIANQNYTRFHSYDKQIWGFIYRGKSSRSAWLRSINDLESAKKVIRNLCKRLDRSSLTGLKALRLMSGEARQARSAVAKLGGQSRALKSRAYLAKTVAFVYWKDWQEGRLTFKSGAAFIRFVLTKIDIESEKTVLRWMKKWTAESKRVD